MATLRKFSFAGGEISPSMHARADQTKHAIGLRTCRNFFPQRHGGLANRPGTKFMSELRDSDKIARLVPFIFSDTVTYVLAFNDGKIRFYTNGAQLLLPPNTISGITQANPARITTTGAHGYATGDEVFLKDIPGMTELNGRNVRVVLFSATEFDITDLDGNNIDSTGFTAYGPGPAGTAEQVLEIDHPYSDAELSDLQWAQSADVLTLVHSGHFIRELKRVSNTSWVLERLQTIPKVARPTGLATAGSGGGALNISYIMTAVRNSDLEESGAGVSDARVVSAITQAALGVVTCTAAHVFAADDEVVLYSAVPTTQTTGMPEVHDRRFIVASVASPDLTIEEDTGAYTLDAAGFANLHVGRVGVHLTAVAAPSSGSPITVSCNPVGGAQFFTYRVYRRDSVNGVYGFIGEAVFDPAGATVDFVDTGITPDTSSQNPVERMPFHKAGLFPSAVAYFQQRRCFGGSDDEPETVYCSQIGKHSNFYTYFPTTDDDTVIFGLAGQKVSKIKHLLDLGKLVVFTTSIEWVVNGSASGALTPTDINAVAQSYHGSGDRRPIVVGGNALFLQNRGTIVRDLAFDFVVEGYRGNELTIFADHLFDNFTLTDWDFQQVQNSIVWAVRSDGRMVSLTYIREHEIFAWARHDLQEGTFENVAVVSEGNEDILYVVSKRTINGSVRRYVERLDTRLVDPDNIRDAIYMDSELAYDGRNTTGTTMTISGGPPWGPFDLALTLTASAAFFTAADVGNEIILRETTVVGAVTTVTTVRFRIDTFVSSTVVMGHPDIDVPTVLQGNAVTDWDKAVDVVTNIHHLEGKEVSVFADGFVIANPNNTQYEKLTVTNGQITLKKPYGVIRVGLPYTSDIETLDLELVDAETFFDKRIGITRVILFLEETRGLWVGEQLPPTDLVTSEKLGGTLHEPRIREDEPYDEPVALHTGTADVEIRGRHNKTGKIVARQTDPIPAKIASIAAAGQIPIRR